MDGGTVEGWYFDDEGDSVHWIFYEDDSVNGLVDDEYINALDVDSDWREQHNPAGGYTYLDFHDRTEVAYGDYVRNMARTEGGVWRDFVQGSPLHPGKRDTDEDGVDDFVEVCNGSDPLDARSTISHDPTYQDQDRDGLWDIEEWILAGTTATTMHLTYDTDGDSLSDGHEMHPTMPCVWDESGPTYAWFDYDGPWFDWDGFTHLNAGAFFVTNPMEADSEDEWGIHDDGLDDREEVVLYGTNPRMRDTDGDGIDDDLEIAHYYSSLIVAPLVFDMDGDRLWDGLEDRNGDGDFNDFLSDNYWPETDPLDGDTDDDGISDGDERTYHTYPRVVDTDEDGIDDGIEVGYTNQPELRLVNIRVDNDPSYPDYEWWGGAFTWTVLWTDDAVFGDGDNDPTTMTDPRLVDSDHDCIEDGDEDLDFDGEYDPGDGETDAQDRDSDDDGLFDYYEYFGAEPTYPTTPVCATYGTWCDNSDDPTLAYEADTDGDGLPDAHEYEQGCVSNDGVDGVADATDTDADGALDGDEFDGDFDGMPVADHYRSDPNNPDTDGDGHDDYIGALDPAVAALVESLGDCDLDGIPNVMDVDSDNDWIRDHDESGDLTDDDEADGFVNILDGDRDNDYLADPIEIGLAIYHPRDMDTDDDGLFDGEEYWQKDWHTVGWSCGGRPDTVDIWKTDPGVDNRSIDTDGDGWPNGATQYYYHDGFEAGRTGGIPTDTTTDPDTPGTGDDLQHWDADGTSNSDPRYVDTDFDGMWDFDEDVDWDGDDLDIDAYGAPSVETNPRDADTDEDGLFDSFEWDWMTSVGGPGPVLTDMPLDCDVDDDVLPDGLELGLLSAMPNAMDSWHGHNGDTDYANGWSECWSINRPYLDTAESGAYNTDPLNPDTDGDTLEDGVEDIDGDGKRDGNDPYDTGLPGGSDETDPNQWDTDRGGVSDADDTQPLINLYGDKDLDITWGSETDVLVMGVDGVGIMPGATWTEEITVVYTDAGNNPETGDGPSPGTAAPIDTLYMRATSLHWAGPHTGVTTSPTPDEDDWMHYSVIAFSPWYDEDINPGDEVPVDVTVSIPDGAMPGWYTGYVQVETKRDGPDGGGDGYPNELPDDFIEIRVWVSPAKDIDICDMDGDPMGVGPDSDPFDFEMMAGMPPAMAEMHLVGMPGHPRGPKGNFRFANPNTNPDGVWPYNMGSPPAPDGVNDYNALDAAPYYTRCWAESLYGWTWDSAAVQDYQGNQDLETIVAQYEHISGPDDISDMVSFGADLSHGGDDDPMTNMVAESLPLGVLREAASVDSGWIYVDSSELEAGLYVGIVRVFEDIVDSFGDPYPDEIWQPAWEVSDTFRVAIWLTSPDLDIDDAYAGMSGNHITADIDPEDSNPQLLYEARLVNASETVNTDDWDGPSMERTEDFWLYRPDPAADGLVDDGTFGVHYDRIPTTDQPVDPGTIGGIPFRVWHTDIDEYLTVWVDGVMEDTLNIGEAKKLRMWVEIPEENPMPPAGDFTTRFDIDDDPDTYWPYGDGTVAFVTRGRATGIGLRPEFFDEMLYPELAEDGEGWDTNPANPWGPGYMFSPHPDSLTATELLMDYFQLTVSVPAIPMAEFESPDAEIIGEPGEETCGTITVLNTGNVDMGNISFELPQYLVGEEHGMTIPGDLLTMMPEQFEIPYGEDQEIEVCYAIAGDVRADTYVGTVQLLSDGEPMMSTLELSVTVECVPAMAITDTEYDLVAGTMDYVAGIGGSGMLQFEVCNLGNCEIPDVETMADGFPTGLDVVITLDETLPWDECLVGMIEVDWTDASLNDSTYVGTVTVTDGALTDVFTLAIECHTDMNVVDNALGVVGNIMHVAPDPGATAMKQFELENTGNDDVTGITVDTVTGLPSGLAVDVDVDGTLPWNDSVVADVEVEWSDPEVPAGTYTATIVVRANGDLMDSFTLEIEVAPLMSVAFYDTETVDVIGVAGEMAQAHVVVMNTGNIDITSGITFTIDDLVGETGSMIPSDNIQLDPETAAIADGDTMSFALDIDVPEGLLGQDYTGTLYLWLNGQEQDDVDVTVTIERGDVIAIYPNPYRMAEHDGGVTIAIGDVSGDLEVMVYDMYGVLVAELTGEAAERGTDIQWDLKNDDGKTVASGMYLVTIDTGDEVVTRQIMVIK